MKLYNSKAKKLSTNHSLQVYVWFKSEWPAPNQTQKDTTIQITHT